MAGKEDPKKLVGLLLGGGLILAAGVMLFTYSPPDPEPPPPVVRPAKTETLDSPEEASLREYTGKVQAAQEVELSFRVSGPLVEFAMKANQKVEKGDLLGRIVPRDFQVALRSMEASLDEARAKLKAMEVGARPEDIEKFTAEVERTQAEVDRATNDYERYKKALETNAVSRSDVDRQRQMKQRAEALLKTAQNNLKIGQVGARAEDIEAKKAEIRSLEASRDAAADQLEYTYLRAPFSGQVARTYVENFQDVQAKQPILSLQDVSSIEIEVDVPEAVVAGINLEHVKRYLVRIEAVKDREFEVEFTEAEIDANSRTQTYAVTFALPRPEGVRILPGMSAAVRFEMKSSAELGGDVVWFVPSDALFADEHGNSYVWKVAKPAMKVTRTKVETGSLKDDRIEIVGGLAAGDTIVTAGVQLLVEGQQVRELESTAR